jgi:hypothetical protein
MGIDIESFSSTSPTDPSDPSSHTASVAGFWRKKAPTMTNFCLQHDPSSTVTPTSCNDPSTPKHLLLSFLLKSNNFIQQEFSEFTWPADNGIIFFSNGESKLQNIWHLVASIFHMSPILFPSFPCFPRCYHPKPSHGRCRLADPRGQHGHCAIGGGWEFSTELVLTSGFGWFARHF